MVFSVHAVTSEYDVPTQMQHFDFEVEAASSEEAQRQASDIIHDATQDNAAIIVLDIEAK